jgi:surface polysaccharide O-acyltransferase-like enzyme
LTRIESVDAWRLAAVAAVIAIHTQPFWSPSSSGRDVLDSGILINQLSRFAVPFFYTISGYFWGTKIVTASSPTAVSRLMARKISLIFLYWSVIYLLPYNLTTVSILGYAGPFKTSYWHAAALLKRPLDVLFQGTSQHLWFLPSLLMALGISNFFVTKKLPKTLVLIALSLYLLGLLGKAYAQSPIGIHTTFNTRNGPFFSTIFFASGYFLSKFTPSRAWFLYGIATLSLGILIHFSELVFISRMYGTSIKQDYVIGTYFMGLGSAIASLSGIISVKRTRLQGIAHLSLGIYAVHLIFVELLEPIFKQSNSKFSGMIFFGCVLALSITSVKLLSLGKVTSKLVQ